MTARGNVNVCRCIADRRTGAVTLSAARPRASGDPVYGCSDSRFRGNERRGLIRRICLSSWQRCGDALRFAAGPSIRSMIEDVRPRFALRHRPLARDRRADRASPSTSPSANLSAAGGAHRQSVPAGRLGRHHGAHPGAEAHGKSRAAVHRRQPRRRRRQCRRRVRREVGARRPHALVHRAGAAGGQSDAVHQGPAVRPGQGLRADRAVRHRADRADGQSGRAGQQRAKS